MKLSDYQKLAVKTAVYPSDVALPYLALGLAGEAAEVANKIKKIIRGDYDDNPTHAELALSAVAHELGDTLWYIAVLADELGVELDTVGLNNLAKLHNREIHGTLKGSGDNR